MRTAYLLNTCTHITYIFCLGSYKQEQWKYSLIKKTDSCIFQNAF
jgi:hypothetical protein